MGKPSLVFDQWIGHLRGEVHSKTSMKFDKSKNVPVKKLSSFYIIGDTTQATECYVFAHGGSFKDEYVISHTTFTVPKGVTIEFYQPDGYMVCFAAKALRTAAPVKASEGWQDLQYKTGDTCPNYILSKNQGAHQSSNWSVDDSKAFDMDYEGLQSVAAAAGVVIVTVRNRWFHAGVTLSTLVTEVTKSAKGLTTFHCMFCRVRENSDNWAYTAGASTSADTIGWQQA